VTKKYPIYSGGGRWGLKGPEPLQLCTWKGRAPPKIVDYDIIYLITCLFKIAYREVHAYHVAKCSVCQTLGLSLRKY